MVEKAEFSASTHVDVVCEEFLDVFLAGALGGAVVEVDVNLKAAFVCIDHLVNDLRVGKREHCHDHSLFGVLN